MPRLRLTAITLSGGNRELVAPGAWKSVSSLVDHYLLVDTGESAQKALESARKMKATRNRHAVVEFPGDYGKASCADGRNFGLEQAAVLGFDWALILDTDERIHVATEGVREFLETTEANTVQIFNREYTYSKERFIKLPSPGRYYGRVHEEFLGDSVVRAALDSVAFSEVPKSPEDAAATQAMVERESFQWLIDEPDSLRARASLANSLVAQKRYQEAIPYYLDYSSRTPSQIEHGWAIFMAASCYGWIGDREKAIELCTVGLRRCPYLVEFYWLAAVQELQRNNAINAGSWADAAIALGRTSHLKRARPVRVGYQVPEAEFEGPWEIRRNVMRALGRDKLADDAQSMVDKAKKQREMRSCDSAWRVHESS